MTAKNKGTIWIEAAIKTKQPFPFKEPILGFNSFQIDIWEQKIFETTYVRGNPSQDEGFVLRTSIKALRLQYGKNNVKVTAYIFNELGSKTPYIEHEHD